MKACIKCHAESPDKAKFCPECGMPFRAVAISEDVEGEEVLECSDCKGESPLGATKCVHCGATFDDDSDGVVEGEEVLECSDCKGESPLGATKCAHCGATFDDDFEEVDADDIERVFFQIEPSAFKANVFLGNLSKSTNKIRELINAKPKGDGKYFSWQAYGNDIMVTRKKEENGVSVQGLDQPKTEVFERKDPTRFQFIDGTTRDQAPEIRTKIEGRSLAGDTQMLALAAEMPEEILDDQRYLEQVRNYIGDWASAIPHHPYKTLGTEIDIQKMVSLGSYRIELMAQIEKRTVRNDIMPYRNEPIGPKLICDKSTVDPWKFKTAVTTDFIEHSQTYVLQASREIEVCPTCSGQGELNCEGCSGKGENRCNSCSGSGEVRCGSCGGSGQIHCWRCNGDGHTGHGDSKARCSSCGGRGHKGPCTNCRNGYKNCDRCGGRGNITCSSCAGHGKVTCYQCDGNCQVISFICFDDEFIVKKDARLVLHPLLPEDVVSGNPDPIFKAKVDAVAGKYKPLTSINTGVDAQREDLSIAKQEGVDLFLLEQEQIPFSVQAGLAHHELATACRLLLVGEAGEGAIALGDSSSRQLNHRLRVTKIRTWKISYYLGKKDYEMVIYGDGPLIWAPVSPISEVATGYLSEAKVALAKYSPDTSFDLIEKALAINSDSLEAVRLKERVGKIFRLDFIIGAAIGTLILYGIGQWGDEHLFPRELRERSVYGTFPLITARVLFGIFLGIYYSRSKNLLWPLKQWEVLRRLVGGILVSLAVSFAMYLWGVNVLGYMFTPAAYIVAAIIGALTGALSLYSHLGDKKPDSWNLSKQRFLFYLTVLLYVPSFRVVMTYFDPAKGLIDPILWINYVIAACGLAWVIGTLLWRSQKYDVRRRTIRIMVASIVVVVLLITSLLLRRLLLNLVGV
jgi:hypothetical protein